MAQSDPFPDPNPTVDHFSKAESLPTSNIDRHNRSTVIVGRMGPSESAQFPRIAGYRITSQIAQGGMGRVYAAHDQTLDREVAIKTLLPNANAERFTTEAKITAKLPHPNIPPVYALGRLDDGTPWLAMKRIHGQTLANLLEGRQRSLMGELPTDDVRGQFDDLPRFIHIFEQICQAVGFAHSRGILHRDLKPLNVMVGEFGEVQVMDWGLAKELARRQSSVLEEISPDDARRRFAEGSTDNALPPVDDPQTRAGTILGTPGYMAPEQARGESVDARADVFALGSILATILTGQPAFVGATVQQIITRSANAELEDAWTRLDSCRADAELVNLAKRCLAAHRDDRPADAQVLAQELAAYRAGVERRLRQAETDRARAETQVAEQAKRRRVVQWAGGLIAAVLLIGFAVSLWQMTRAIRAERQARQNEQWAIDNARTAAEERDAKAKALLAETAALQAEQQARAAEMQARDQAMKALRTLTDELVENQLARGESWTDENQEFLRMVIKQFEGFAAITSNNAESRAIRAEGYLRVGLMRRSLGEPAEAEQAFRTAIDLYRPLVADFPNRPEFREDLAKSHGNLALILQATGRLKEAEQAFHTIQQLLQQQAADFPDRPESRSALAKNHNNLGVLLRDTGRLEEAEQAFKTAIDVLRRLVADFPNRPEFRNDLANTYGNLALLLRVTGRLKEAEQAFRAALNFQKQLSTDFPYRPNFRADMAKSYNNLALLLRVTGRPQESEQVLHEALQVRQQLVTDYPHRAEFRSALARSHNNLGLLWHATNRLKEAEQAYQAAGELFRQLVLQFPQQPDWHNDLAANWVNLALLRQQQGDLATAKKYLDEGRPHHLAALKANPQHLNYRQFYRNHLNALTTVYAGLLQPEDAVRTAHLRRDVGWNPPADAYDAAGFLSNCLPVVAKHNGLDAEQRRQARAFYAEEAMKLLYHAVAKGFTDAAHLKREGRFTPLRQREDFRKLLAEIEAKSPK